MKESIKINLLKDLRDICEKDMEILGIQRKDLNDPIMDYCRFIRRSIIQRPRDVYKPVDFLCPRGYEQKLQFLESSIKSGEDLNPFLTKNIMKLRREDLMLYDWNIYHFHISNKVEVNSAEGFMERSDYLLMALVTENVVYFLEIVPHCGLDSSMLWANRKYIDIIRENWPELLEDDTLGEITISEDASDTEIYNRRKSHINTIITNDKNCASGLYGGGYTLDGTSLLAVDEANRISCECETIEKILKQNFWTLVDEDQKLSDMFNDKIIPEIKLTAIYENCFFLQEITKNMSLKVEYFGDSKFNISTVIDSEDSEK